jgi:hypothetical protein
MWQPARPEEATVVTNHLAFKLEEEQGHPAAAAAWERRARAARDASEVFARLAAHLRTTKASELVVALAERAARDEVRAETICAALARGLGGNGVAPGVASSHQVAPEGLNPERQALYEAVALCCVRKTVDIALLQAALETSRDVRVKLGLRDLLSDKVVHARIGWTHLEWCAKRSGVRWLGRYLSRMLEDVWDAEPSFLDGSETPDLREYGVPTMAAQRTAVQAALVEEVFPRLEAQGVPTRATPNWLEHRLEEPPA